jgi:hypothetical protein
VSDSTSTVCFFPLMFRVYLLMADLACY